MYKNLSFISLSITLLLSAVHIAPAQMGMGMGGGMGGGFGGRGGGRGGMGRTPAALLKTYDKNGDGWLNSEERKAARGLRSTSVPVKPVKYGIDLKPENVKWYTDEPLYDITTLRTLFLEFEDVDWETELEYFFRSDVEVPAKLTVDGKTYENVGVRFRGNTSYSMAGSGWKRPLNITMDLVNKNQHLYGYRTLNLMNSITDPTFVRQVLFHKISGVYMPALKANYVRLVINGEHWGVYVNLQQFNTDFIKDEFDTRKGERWKAPLGGNVGLSYLGDNIASYKNAYEIKSKDDPNSWAALANLCKVLNQTPTNKLEEAIKPILDVNEALKFMAMDNISANGDGYWERASDYLIYRDKTGRFYVFAYDTLETFSASGGGRGGMGGRGGGGGGTRLNPFSGSGALYRLLSVPSLKQRYAGYVRDIAEKWLNWDKILPLVNQYQTLIAADMQADMRNPNSLANFHIDPAGSSLQNFVNQRRAYLLSIKDVNQAPLP